MKQSLIFFVIFFFSGIAYSSPESNLYQFEHYKLDNGLSIVLKKRTHSPNVSIRLVVEVGHRYFSCDKADAAHFLEHMLFMGTTKFTENELDDIIESSGGAWNAKTMNMRTVYEIDMYSKNIATGLNVLFEIMTESTLSKQQFETAKQIVYREGEGEQSDMVYWLYKQGLGKSASSKLNEWMIGKEEACEGPINMENLYYEDIKNTFSSYYQPDNMTLVIVGDIDENLKPLIANLFGKMKTKESKRYVPKMPPRHKEANLFFGTLNPLLGTDAYIEIVYRTEGNRHDDHYPLSILSFYLKDILYKQIRVEQGLAYAPYAIYSATHDYGLFSLESDANLADVDKVIASLNAILKRTKEQGVDEKRLEAIKKYFLLTLRQGYEQNLSFANHYALVTADLNKNGSINNIEEKVKKVTLQDVNNVLKKYFDKEMEVVAITRPFMTYTLFYALLVLVPLGGGGLLLFLRRR